MSSRLFYASFVVIGFAGCMGCGKTSAAGSGNNSEIETVRNGVLATYNSTTVGKAFEATFQNPKWSTFDTPKGQTIVQFDGTVQSGLLTKMTGAELTNAPAFYTNDARRTTCMSSVGLVGALDDLKQKARESDEQYRASVETISRQFAGKLYNESTGHPHSPFDNQPYILSPAGGSAYPFRELDAARRDQLGTERQAVFAVNDKIAECMNRAAKPVKFQFVLNADKRSFTLDYVDDAFKNDAARALSFIYR